ncbi:NADPH dehydrogenase NamA [Enterococcus faecalis]
MSTKLFSPITIKNVTLKNRIVMSPMCMYSADEQTGLVTEWHKHHYVTRAMGGVGLIMVESTAILSNGKINKPDLGLWNDEQIEKMKELVNSIHHYGAKIGIQISHAGRKAELEDPKLAPSPIAFPNMDTPKEMNQQDILDYISAFKQATRRAKEAGFDILEIHAAHGFLINEFLSPLTNQRQDEYGGNLANRYRFLRETIEAVKSVWTGPLFVRISGNEYHENGNQLHDFLKFSEWMKEQGVDLIDCSSGGIVPAKIDVYPGYQMVPAKVIKSSVDVMTGGVGLITNPKYAEEILIKNQADLIFLGRELLRNPYWAYKAAKILHTETSFPIQYKMAFRNFF